MNRGADSNGAAAGAAPGRIRGRAEDGAIVVIDGPADLLADLSPWWPPLGLEPLGADDRRTEPADAAGPADLMVNLTAGPGGATVHLDGKEAPGGWDRVESEMGLFSAEHLGDLVAVHAGVVRWEGTALIIPGASHAGKSTLVLALADAGAEVLSDEYALVDPASGAVFGWPRPVRRRVSGGSIERPLVPRTVREAVPVAVVATMRFDPGARLDLEAVDAATAAFDLLANTVPARRRPRAALAAAAAVARSAASFRGRRGEADDAAQALLALAAARHR